MNNIQRILYRELYKKSFYDFVKDFWSSADPSKLVDGKLIQYQKAIKALLTIMLVMKKSI